MSRIHVIAAKNELCLHALFLLRAGRQDEFMHAIARLRDVVVSGEARLEVIGVEDGVLGNAPQPLPSQRFDIAVRAQDGTGVSVKGAHPADGMRAVVFPGQPFLRFDEAGQREKFLEMRLHADRAGARASRAVRDGKRLVQVHVHDVEAHVARPRDT